MRNTLNRSLPGTRLQGDRHGKTRRVNISAQSSKTTHLGNMEYPVETIYTGRKSKSKTDSSNKELV